MSDLSEFLLARIAEDEEAARYSPDRWGPTDRAAKECEAKRQIVARHDPAHEDGDPYAWAIYDVLADLATTYADHPDYRDEWKP